MWNPSREIGSARTQVGGSGPISQQGCQIYRRGGFFWPFSLLIPLKSERSRRGVLDLRGKKNEKTVLHPVAVYISLTSWRAKRRPDDEPRRVIRGHHSWDVRRWPFLHKPRRRRPIRQPGSVIF